MTKVIKLTGEENKEHKLLQAIRSTNEYRSNSHCFEFSSKDLEKIPGAPFAYWVGNSIREKFSNYINLGNLGDGAKQGIATADDFRFVRNWWEVSEEEYWRPFAKGGSYARFHSDINLVVNWLNDGHEIKNFADIKTKKIRSRPQNINFSMIPGLTWSDRTTSLFSSRMWPSGGVFSIKGSAGFFYENNFHVLAIMNSLAFNYLLSLMVGAADSAAKSYQVGTLNKVPIPPYSEELAKLSQRAWQLHYCLDTINEESHAFVMPYTMLSNNILDEIVEELTAVEKKIETLCFELYDFNENDIRSAKTTLPNPKECFDPRGEKTHRDEFLLWAIGLAFGRFGLKEANCKMDLQNSVPIEFSDLGKTSPAMSGNKMFQAPSPYLVQSSSDSISLESILNRIISHLELGTDADINEWLSNDAFDVALSKYTKSRRQAPIYWPISSLGLSCTIWLYFPKVNSQTILECINNIIEPQLSDIKNEISILRSEQKLPQEGLKKLENLCLNEQELEGFIDELTKISKFWQPNLHDGVQVNAAPLWRLFQHKAWQKKLKQTWEKLEEGEYDWAHLAFSTWPERVLKKCHADRSLAIAHDVEDDLWHEVEVIKGRKKEPVWEWQPKPLSEPELRAYIKEKVATDDRLKLYRSNQSNNAKGDAW